MIRVLVVAHSMVMRAGLEAIVSAPGSTPGLTLVGSTAYSDHLGQQIEQLQPDVVLLEWTARETPDLLTLLNPEVESNPGESDPGLVLLVEDLSDSSVADLLRAGVRGVLPIEASASDIGGAIAAAAAGLTVLHPETLEALLPVLSTSFRSLPDTSQPLTAREVDVLEMLAQGLGNKTIARHLTISEHTVKFHISSIFSKLNASSRTEAVILGARQGLILI